MPVLLKDGSSVQDPRLDRLVEFDEASRGFPFRTLVTAREHARPRSFTWRVDHWLDQGQEGRCVEYAICHELLARPTRVASGTVMRILEEKGIYWPAQQEDQWVGGSYPGAKPFYEGTSVLAGMKVAKRLGYFTEYRWAFGLQDLVTAIGYHGPAVLGLNWYRGQQTPDSNGFIHPTGPLDGGHALLAHAVKIHWKVGSLLTFWKARTWDDVDIDRSYVWLWNSWGPDWGRKGRCRITFRELDQLLQEQGEAAIPVTRAHGVLA